MPDNNAALPEEPVEEPTPPQQTPAPRVTSPPEGFIEKGRFDGAIRKVEELTLANRELNAQLTQRASEYEQLDAQLGIKDTEKVVAISERDKRLQEALTQNQELSSKVVDLQALALKVKVAKELGHPELLELADTIPNLTDEEALKTVMSDVMRFAETQVQAREQQLMAGVGPPPGPGNAVVDSPQSKEGWEEHVNTLPLGSPERARAMDKYGDWLERANTKP